MASAAACQCNSGIGSGSILVGGGWGEAACSPLPLNFQGGNTPRSLMSVKIIVKSIGSNGEKGFSSLAASADLAIRLIGHKTD